MWLNLQETADLVSFTEKILNGKFHCFVQCNIKGKIKTAVHYCMVTKPSQQHSLVGVIPRLIIYMLQLVQNQTILD